MVGAQRVLDFLQDQPGDVVDAQVAGQAVAELVQQVQLFVGVDDLGRRGYRSRCAALLPSWARGWCAIRRRPSRVA